MKKTALLIIGDEILTGRTQDTNTAFLATELAAMGLPLGETRTVPDELDEIVAALNALRAKYAYVFTTGGIGPTHDDITADAVALAFGLPLIFHPDALARLEAHYANTPDRLNDARRRMARTPEGAMLIDNAVTIAPGFAIGNVFVLAGVPKIMQAMFTALKPRLQGGAPLLSHTLNCRIREGDLSAPFEAVAKRYPQLSFGSYPSMQPVQAGAPLGQHPTWQVQLVVRGYDAAPVDAAFAELQDMVRTLGDVPEIIN
jgi:molybdenum cofactor synthesis domain-containing protein